ILGISFGRKLDDRLYMAGEFNYFKSSYRKQSTVADYVDTLGTIRFREVQTELEFNTRIFFVMGKLDYELRLSEQTPLFFRASGGLGFEFIWNDENNYLEDIERSRFFWGFGYKLSGGLGLKISRTGLLFIDGIYNNATASRNKERNEQGLPTAQVIDVSGFGFQVGVNLVGLNIFSVF
ncbi:MAG TPA: hypothetical protein PLG66_13190, partial [Calditrichia bacterium]|nr:hypothetical protein [Calditrichia bacterium]